MNAHEREAVIDFVDAVSQAIARQACSKDVDWLGVIEAADTLKIILRNQDDNPQ